MGPRVSARRRGGWWRDVTARLGRRVGPVAAAALVGGLVLGFVPGAASAVAQGERPPRERPPSAAGASPTAADPVATRAHLVVVTGLPGNAAYADALHDLASRMRAAARERGLPESHLLWLAEDPGRSTEILARSTAENVERVLSELASRAGPGDFVLVLLLGHGSARDGQSRLNLPGPDPTGADVDRMLSAFPTQTVAVVNAASASGGFVDALSGDRRVVITATRSPRETNATRFPRHFVEAFAGEGADRDRDGRVSLLEAFDYARLEVARAFEEESALATEHALLDDDGDGEGSLEPDPDRGDGRLAGNLFLTGRAGAVAETRRAAGDPELAALYARRVELEARLDSLRAREEAMEPAAYEEGLEEILVELSLVSRRIEEREGGGEEGPP